MGRERSEKCAGGVKSPGLGVGVGGQRQNGRCFSDAGTWWKMADSEMVQALPRKPCFQGS